MFELIAGARRELGDANRRQLTIAASVLILLQAAIGTRPAIQLGT
jgi:hypothetical protein